MSGQLLTSAAVPTGKEPPPSPWRLNMRLCGPQSVWTLRRKDLLFQLGMEQNTRVRNGLKYLGYDMMYFLTAIGLTPGGSSTVHNYAQTVHRTTQLTNWEECEPCPVFASYTLAFA